MSHPSEERVPQNPAQAAESATARIIPFERPQSDLQRAIQLRAQEAIDRDRDREADQRKPKPVKRILIFALATIPVFMVLGLVDGFLRVMHRVNEIYAAPPAATEPAPVEVEEGPLRSNEPGVVILQPLNGGVQALPAEASDSASQAPADSR